MKLRLRGSNKLLISGSVSFRLAEYFLIIERYSVFAWHREVDWPLEPFKLEANPAVKPWKRTILKPPSPTARAGKSDTCGSYRVYGETDVCRVRGVYRGVYTEGYTAGTPDRSTQLKEDVRFDVSFCSLGQH